MSTRLSVVVTPWIDSLADSPPPRTRGFPMKIPASSLHVYTYYRSTRLSVDVTPWVVIYPAGFTPSPHAEIPYENPCGIFKDSLRGILLLIRKSLRDFTHSGNPFGIPYIPLRGYYYY